MADALTWAAAPQPDPTRDPAPESPAATVAIAGARQLCHQADVDYDACSAESQQHYQLMATAVFIDMWNTAVETGWKVEAEHVDPDGNPVEPDGGALS